MKFGFIAKHRMVWPVAWPCDAQGVSRSGFHAWLNRSPSARSRSDEELGARIKTSFMASDRTYGARRVWRDLLVEGVDCGLHRIERLMRLQGLRARPRRRRLPKDGGDRRLETVPVNLLNREFNTERPNQKWIADFTYLWTAKGWLYVAAVIDLFSRRVVGWSMSAAMTARQAGCAVTSHRPGQPVHQRAVPDPDGRLRHHMLYELFRRCLGQCVDGELLPRSRPNGRIGGSTGPEMRREPMCPIISRDSTILPAGTRPSATSARLSSSARWDQLNQTSIKPAAAQAQGITLNLVSAGLMFCFLARIVPLAAGLDKNSTQQINRLTKLTCYSGREVTTETYGKQQAVSLRFVELKVGELCSVS